LQRLLHFIPSYWPNVLLSVKMHCHVGQTNKQALPPRHFSNDQNTLTLENCWEKRLHTDRERE
jgi:hypothetical protein